VIQPGDRVIPPGDRVIPPGDRVIPPDDRVIPPGVVAGFAVSVTLDGGPRRRYLAAMDPAGIPALREAIKYLHRLDATWLESVAVHEQHEGRTVWQGEVQVFAVEHPKASRVYAWSHETENGRRRFHAVLGAPPVDGPKMAVRTAVLSDQRRNN
jgi:hypothetical protein